MNIEIHQKPRGRTVEVFAYQEKGNVDVFYSMDNGQITATEVERFTAFANEEIKPLLVIDTRMWPLLLGELAKEAEKQGVATERTDTVKGKMDAMQEHIKDLQKIVMPMVAHLTNLKESTAE